MSKVKTILYTLAVLAISAGLVVIGFAAFFLRRLDEHAFGDPNVYYSTSRHYGLMSSVGGLVCLTGFILLAVAFDYKQGFRAGTRLLAIGFGLAVFGLFLFPIHNPSGAIYFTLVGLAFCSSLSFFLAAIVRYLWYKARVVA